MASVPLRLQFHTLFYLDLILMRAQWLNASVRLIRYTSKCMHGMNQTEAEYSRHGKRSQRASLSQIGPVVLEE